jgi:hypothetical protein
MCISTVLRLIKFMCSFLLAGLMVCSGKLTLLRCEITENKSDGIVVQAENETARLEVKSCIVNRNQHMGVVVYGGHADIADSRIQENAFGGFAAHPEMMGEPLHSVRLSRNVISGNGGGMSILISAKKNMLGSK